ncbi:NAD(P)H-dependent oxidoreductase [Streptomyces anthocyanicus]|uniref:NAD(P)H-dependent oxidoreductase n=1 Tax=Streptomyces anthocyanicus TaxID=68174 RepID=UPI002F3E8665
MVGGLPGEQLKDALASLALADIVVAATLVYKAGFSGLFKSFVDVMDDLLIGKPVVLAATAGSARHTMVADDRLRPLFTFLRAVTVPTAVFAAPSVWADPAQS